MGFSPFFGIDWLNYYTGFRVMPRLQRDWKMRGTVFSDVAGFQPGENPDFSAGSGIFKIQLAGNL
jgi:hypothetical protein